MYSDDGGGAYSAMNVSAGSAAAAGLLSPTSDSSISFPLPSRYRQLYVRYKKPLAFVLVFVVLAFIIGLVVVLSRPPGSGEDDGTEQQPSSSSSSSSPPAAAHSASSSTGEGPPPTPPGRLFSFSDAFSSSLTLRYAALSWSPWDDSFISRGADGRLLRTQPGNGSVSILATAALMAEYELAAYSADYRFLLLRKEYQALYRHSGRALYFVLDRLPNPPQLSPLSDDWVQYAAFSPSISSPAVAFVQRNNVFMLDLLTGLSAQITSDGAANRIINGVCDWVYEEEIWLRTGALFFSPTGQYLAFLRFDESAVPEYAFTLFGLPHNTQYSYKYPLVADNNSVVSLALYDTQQDAFTLVDLGGASTEQYVINVVWLGASTVGVKLMPRLQANWTLYAVDATQPSATLQPLSSQSHPFYLEVDFTLRFLPSLQSWLDSIIVNGRQHLALYAADGSLQRLITSSSEWGVETLHCFDSASSTLYFTSTFPSSIERTLMAADLSSPGRVYPVLPTRSPQWQSSVFSGQCGFFTVSEQANPQLLNTRLFAVNRSDPFSPRELAVLQDNSATLTRLKDYNLPTQHFTTFASASAPDYDLNAFFLLPPTFKGDLAQPDCSYRYPVLINVYGGPGSQSVSRRFGLGGNAGLGWQTFLSGSKGYVSLVFDPVGTGGQGDVFQKNFTTWQLWVKEEADVMAVIAGLSSLCFIDSQRIAYWGWSYGGSMAARVATSSLLPRGAVNTAIAVAPVTDWTLYDSIYSERYMRTPGSNPINGFNLTTLLGSRARNLTAGSFLLVHGTADDNVHWQNSALLVEALTRNGQQFSQFSYTNANHAMRGFFGFEQSNTLHLYRMLYQFLSGMVFGRGGDPLGVAVSGQHDDDAAEDEQRLMQRLTAELQATSSDDVLAVMREKFFQV